MQLAMKGLGFSDSSRADIEKLLREIDTDGNGCIDYPEFHKMMKAKMAQKDSPEEILKAFHLFDKNKGHITIHDLKEVAKSLGENPNDELLKEMIEVADSDKDGIVSFAEFQAMMLTTVVK
eukprot:TRINITY_DN7875_c0_g1_i2.p1 TRINITY_DN7875_c0_g1~~TRINITY_DN7875_c0_g1_i2.p1  ORF type:complete len:121 (+),score=31.35 TRINITY_DN7875_c0_g1_i2:188-550(+)